MGVKACQTWGVKRGARGKNRCATKSRFSFVKEKAMRNRFALMPRGCCRSRGADASARRGGDGAGVERDVIRGNVSIASIAPVWHSPEDRQTLSRQRLLCDNHRDQQAASRPGRTYSRSGLAAVFVLDPAFSVHSTESETSAITGPRPTRRRLTCARCKRCHGPG